MPKIDTYNFWQISRSLDTYLAGDVHPAAPRLAAAGEGDVVVSAHGRGRGLQLLGLGARAGAAGPGGGGGAVLGGGLVPAPGPWTHGQMCHVMTITIIV